MLSKCIIFFYPRDLFNATWTWWELVNAPSIKDGDRVAWNFKWPRYEFWGNWQKWISMFSAPFSFEHKLNRRLNQTRRSEIVRLLTILSAGGWKQQSYTYLSVTILYLEADCVNTAFVVVVFILLLLLLLLLFVLFSVVFFFQAYGN